MTEFTLPLITPEEFALRVSGSARTSSSVSAAFSRRHHRHVDSAAENRIDKARRIAREKPALALQSCMLR